MKNAKLIPGASIGMHTHEDSCEVIFILEGCGSIIEDGKSCPGSILKEYNILFIDDFLAMGNATLGVIDLAKQCGATVQLITLGVH